MLLRLLLLFSHSLPLPTTVNLVHQMAAKKTAKPIHQMVTLWLRLNFLPRHNKRYVSLSLWKFINEIILAEGKAGKHFSREIRSATAAEAKAERFVSHRGKAITAETARGTENEAPGSCHPASTCNKLAS